MMLSLIGGGLAAVDGGLWSAFVYFFGELLFYHHRRLHATRDIKTAGLREKTAAINKGAPHPIG